MLVKHGGVPNIGYYKTEYLANDNFAHYSVYDFNYGGWITNCQYYYEVDKDTNIIVGYKITDPNPNKNCRMLPGY